MDCEKANRSASSFAKLHHVAMAKKSGAGKKPPKPKRYQKVAKGGLTIRQSRMAQILSQRAKLGIKSNGEAAVMAGYSPNTARQGANQALNSIRKKAPEILDELGLSVRSVIDNHLRPLLDATTTKVAIEKGKITDYVELADNRIRLDTQKTIFELHGAYPTEQEKQQGSLGVEIIVVDIPRPDRSGVGVKVTASVPAPAARRPAPEEDPRPRD